MNIFVQTLFPVTRIGGGVAGREAISTISSAVLEIMDILRRQMHYSYSHSLISRDFPMIFPKILNNSQDVSMKVKDDI